MQRDKLRSSLAHLGISPSDYRVLKLLPMIYVAWADGKMERVERERIHTFAARAYDLSPAAAALLESWLTRCPSHEYIVEGLRDVYASALAQDDGEVDLSELPALLAYAEAIARSTAEALDQPSAVTAAEEKALLEIARLLHVDHGASWARVLADLRSPPPLPVPASAG
jgi:uncharacterized tellurite resistance protein B-like protein